ncbi:MAG: hypothetical protein JRI86_13410 [Deltaproteobacteria bacterium]|nr:hypothetical protein [Deltaproteobacteria bacterium]
MKKTIIILSFLFTLILTGVLYGTSDQPEEVEAVTAEQVWMNQFPVPMPQVTMRPMPLFSMH